jgi:hypothetical protein
MNMPENLNCSYTDACFRIWGRHLDARDVTARLGIIPSTSFQRGDPGGPNGPWRRGHWSITTREEGLSCDSQLHIEWLLDRLDPVREELLAIISEPGIQADIRCYWESVTGHDGPGFSSSFFRRFAAFNLGLGITLFNSSEEI